eukprot:322783-Chlamydomonas_euryale.AAC.2
MHRHRKTQVATSNSIDCGSHAFEDFTESGCGGEGRGGGERMVGGCNCLIVMSVMLHRKENVPTIPSPPLFFPPPSTTTT